MEGSGVVGRGAIALLDNHSAGAMEVPSVPPAQPASLLYSTTMAHVNTVNLGHVPSFGLQQQQLPALQRNVLAAQQVITSAAMPSQLAPFHVDVAKSIANSNYNNTMPQGGVINLDKAEDGRVMLSNTMVTTGMPTGGVPLNIQQQHNFQGNRLMYEEETVTETATMAPSSEGAAITKSSTKGFISNNVNFEAKV